MIACVCITDIELDWSSPRGVRGDLDVTLFFLASMTSGPSPWRWGGGSARGVRGELNVTLKASAPPRASPRLSVTGHRKEYKKAIGARPCRACGTFHFGAPWGGGALEFKGFGGLQGWVPRGGARSDGTGTPLRGGLLFRAPCSARPRRRPADPHPALAPGGGCERSRSRRAHPQHRSPPLRGLPAH